MSNVKRAIDDLSHVSLSRFTTNKKESSKHKNS